MSKSELASGHVFAGRWLQQDSRQKDEESQTRRDRRADTHDTVDTLDAPDAPGILAAPDVPDTPKTTDTWDTRDRTAPHYGTDVQHAFYGDRAHDHTLTEHRLCHQSY